MSESIRIEELRKEIEKLCGNCDRPDKEELGKIILSSMVLGFNEGLKVPSADRPQGWIPCSESLPSENGDYLISLDFEWGREVEMGAYIDGEWYNDNRHVNIAWMPLPEPWKGVDDE